MDILIIFYFLIIVFLDYFGKGKVLWWVKYIYFLEGELKFGDWLVCFGYRFYLLFK